MKIDKTSVTRLKDSQYEHLHVVVFRCLEEGVGVLDREGSLRCSCRRRPMPRPWS